LKENSEALASLNKTSFTLKSDRQVAQNLSCLSKHFI